MYTSMTDYVHNLQYSERFYNNAYEYYNGYEDYEDYDQDLSKLFFHMKKKTLATIIAYNNPNEHPYPQVRKIRAGGENVTM
jgi:hypothetical protein